MLHLRQFCWQRKLVRRAKTSAGATLAGPLHPLGAPALLADASRSVDEFILVGSVREAADLRPAADQAMSSTATTVQNTCITMNHEHVK